MIDHLLMLLASSSSMFIAGFTTPPPADRSDASEAQRQVVPLPNAPRETGNPPAVLSRTPDASPATAPSGVFARRIVVEGAERLPGAYVDQAISPFVGRRLAKPDLQELLVVVSGLARAQGYIFAYSSIPAQTLKAGTLRLRLDLGSIDEVRTTGADSQTARALLDVLRGHPATKAEVERQLLLVGDLPGLSVGKVRFVREGARGVLVVPLTRKRLSGTASVDNYGLSTLGPVRTQVGIDLNGVLDGRDALSLQAFVTPANTRQFQVLYGRYSRQIGLSGTELAVYSTAAWTRPGGNLGRFDVTGRSLSWGTSITQPLLRSRASSVWLGGSFDHFESDQRTFGNAYRRDSLSTLSLSINSFSHVAGGLLRAGGSVIQGLDALGATAHLDPLASRPQARPDFTTLNIWANWNGKIAGPVSARLAVASQASSSPLLSFEQITLGGPEYGRGYDYVERSGDQGVLGSAELQYNLAGPSSGFYRGGQVYVFTDGGRVTNIAGGYGAGSLYSAGAGVRLRLTSNVYARLEAALPLTDRRYESQDRSPRVWASVGLRF